MTVHANALPVILVGGPTASGKSALALKLAETLDGIVINADSMQVYAELEILTARPGAEALARAPHRLYGVLPASRRCSAALWRDLAMAEIAAAQAVNKRAIVVGGTGLYLRALVEGLAPIPPVADEIRERAEAEYEQLGGAAFRQRLAGEDAATAMRLACGDRQRLVRAWAVLQATGKPLSLWQREPADPPPFSFDCVTLLPPREPLYAACDARLLQMMQDGALEEVARLRRQQLEPSLPAMKALGVPELLAHLTAALPLEAAISAAQQATRNYAKRQLTWFRHQMGGRPLPASFRLYVAHAKFSERFLPEILEFLYQDV